MTILARDIAPDPQPETDECGYCGTRYIVRGGVYGACPHHAGSPCSGGPGGGYWEPLTGLGPDPCDAAW